MVYGSRKIFTGKLELSLIKKHCLVNNLQPFLAVGYFLRGAWHCVTWVIVIFLRMIK